MTRITETVEIARRPEEVFLYVTDFRHFPEWQDNAVSARPLGDVDELRAGSQAEVVRQVGPARVRGTEELVELHAPDHWTVRAGGGPLTTTATGEIEPVDGGERSRVTISLEIEGHGIGSFLEPVLVGPQGRRQLPRNERRLKAVLEGHPPDALGDDREHRTRLWGARHVVTHRLNPFTRSFADRLPGFGLVSHTGRRSGARYLTPVNVFERRKHVVFVLTYGSDADWVKNVRAAGACELRTRGRDLHLVDPELIVDPDRSLAPPPVRVIGGLIGVTEFLRMRKSMTSLDEVRRDLVQARNMRLETRKRDGSWVPTPVNLVEDGGEILFRTWSSSGKAKRLRNDPTVRFAASDARGNPRGPALQGRATLLDGLESAHAAALINRRYPLLQGAAVRLFHRLRGLTTQHYAIRDITCRRRAPRPARRHLRPAAGERASTSSAIVGVSSAATVRATCRRPAPGRPRPAVPRF